MEQLFYLLIATIVSTRGYASLIWIDLKISRYESNVAVALTHDNVYLSKNYGKDWIPLDVDSKSRSSSSTKQNSSTAMSITSSRWTSIDIFKSTIVGVKGAPHGGIYVSNNYGESWVQASSLLYSWRQVVVNPNTMYAVSHNRGIYYSANSGVDWQLLAGDSYSDKDSHTHKYLAMSFDSKYLYTASYITGYIYYSKDGGQTFKCNMTLVADWFSISSSSSGDLVIACIMSSKAYTTDTLHGIYVSDNYGETWIKSDAIAAEWNKVICNSNCSIAYAVAFNLKNIYISIDRGRHWTVYDKRKIELQKTIATNYDGDRLLLATFNDNILRISNCPTGRFYDDYSGICIPCGDYYSSTVGNDYTCVCPEGYLSLGHGTTLECTTCPIHSKSTCTYCNSGIFDGSAATTTSNDSYKICEACTYPYTAGRSNPKSCRNFSIRPSYKVGTAIVVTSLICVYVSSYVKLAGVHTVHNLNYLQQKYALKMLVSLMSIIYLLTAIFYDEILFHLLLFVYIHAITLHLHSMSDVFYYKIRNELHAVLTLLMNRKVASALYSCSIVICAAMIDITYTSMKTGDISVNSHYDDVYTKITFTIAIINMLLTRSIDEAFNVVLAALLLVKICFYSHESTYLYISV